MVLKLHHVYNSMQAKNNKLSTTVHQLPLYKQDGLSITQEAAYPNNYANQRSSTNFKGETHDHKFAVDGDREGGLKIT